MRIFGIDPGADRTGYGCVETDGTRHRIVTCGAIAASASAAFPDKLLQIHQRLAELLRECQPDAVAIENLFFAVNVKSALKLGHARGVAVLAAVEAGVAIVEYTPAEIKRAVVGYGRAEKPQVQQMVKLMLGLPAIPAPHDAADALAVAICHAHCAHTTVPAARGATSWRAYRPAAAPPALPASPKGSADRPGVRDAGRRAKP
ncbi:MAG TPA: crossover junction endodeoxyribonuclease RuvC [Vicinamibacterales bacterium]|nr:crossover junction endodeoxyribonuclease RuvC [Vicinamibacterales bacterium]